MSTLNVVRYTALVSGIFYGILHRRTLAKEAEAKKLAREEHQRESWIEQARKEWKKKQEQESSSSSGVTGVLDSLLGSGSSSSSSKVITDPEDPKFDLEKLIASWEKQSA